MQIVTDLEECKSLWNKYSPKKTIWDDAEIIFGLLDETKKINFLLFDHGLIPLWYDIPYKTYYFFGGDYPEARKLWFDKTKLKEVYDSIPVPVKLIDIKKTEFDNIADFGGFETVLDYRYYLNISNFNSLEDHFASFSKKHKKNIKYDLKKLEEQKYRLEWRKDVDFDLFAKYSVERFGEESDMFDKEYQKEMKLFLKAVKPYLMCVYIFKEDEVIGLEFCAKYNETFHVINGGYNRDHKNIGKLLISECINKAIELNLKEVDFMIGDTGWKELWNLEKEEVLTLKKQNI